MKKELAPLIFLALFKCALPDSPLEKEVYETPKEIIFNINVKTSETKGDYDNSYINSLILDERGKNDKKYTESEEKLREAIRNHMKIILREYGHTEETLEIELSYSQGNETYRNVFMLDKAGK